jgi:hypothetical protein
VDAIESKYRAETAQPFSSHPPAPLAMEMDNHERPLKRQRVDSSASTSLVLKDPQFSTPSTPNLNVIAPFAFAPAPQGSVPPPTRTKPLPRFSTAKKYLDEPPEISVSADGSYFVSQVASSSRPPPRQSEAAVRIKSEPGVEPAPSIQRSKPYIPPGSAIPPVATLEANRSLPPPTSSLLLSLGNKQPSTSKVSSNNVVPSPRNPASRLSATAAPVVTPPAAPSSLPRQTQHDMEMDQSNDLIALKEQLAQVAY